MEGFKKPFHCVPQKKPSNQPASKTSLIMSEIISRMKPGLFWFSLSSGQIPENKIPLPTRTVRQTKPKSRMHWNFFALTCTKTKFLLLYFSARKHSLSTANSGHTLTQDTWHGDLGCLTSFWCAGVKQN